MELLDQYRHFDATPSTAPKAISRSPSQGRTPCDHRPTCVFPRGAPVGRAAPIRSPSSPSSRCRLKSVEKLRACLMKEYRV